MSLNVARLSGRKEQAAMLVADDRLSDAQIGAQLGITDRTLLRWKKQPRFAERVEEIRAEIRNVIETTGIADKFIRVRAQKERWQKLMQLVDERANDPRYADEPGWTTGFLAHSVKVVGKGANQQVIDEFLTDTGLLDQFLKHEKHVAQELGQWTEKREVTGKDGGPILIREIEAVEPPVKQEHDGE